MGELVPKQPSLYQNTHIEKKYNFLKKSVILFFNFEIILLVDTLSKNDSVRLSRFTVINRDSVVAKSVRGTISAKNTDSPGLCTNEGT